LVIELCRTLVRPPITPASPLGRPECPAVVVGAVGDSGVIADEYAGIPTSQLRAGELAAQLIRFR
jgi:hypothetical protein